MGVVYRAADLDTAQTVALKVLRAHLSAESRARFEREAKVLAELSHPKVVAYIAHGATGAGEPFLAMEWVEGETLRKRLRRGALGIDESICVARQLAQALAAAHARGIVHRDIKPGNVVLAAGRVDRLKLLDFGIARLADADRPLTRTGEMLGTPAYMAPEQARAAKKVGEPSDLYSLGCVVFQCLTGRKPFAAKDFAAVLMQVVLEPAPKLGELLPAAPRALGELIDRLLAKQPAERPASAAEVLHALDEIERGVAPPSSPSGGMITAAERRVTCLILASAQPAEADSTAARRPSDDPRLRRLGAVAHRYGGVSHLLSDGSSVVALSGAAALGDLVTRAARCALELRPMLAGAAMALVTGQARGTSCDSMGELIERGVACLRQGSREAVRLDEVTRGLVDSRFELGGDARGALLRGEREQPDAGWCGLEGVQPCVGRDRELDILDGLLEECCSEPLAQVALITGEAGIGKTRLAEEFLRRAKKRDAQVSLWIGRADPMATDSPFFVAAQALRHALGVDDDEPLAVQQDKVRAELERLLPAGELERGAAFLGELMGVPLSDRDNAPLRAARHSPKLCYQQMRRAFEDTVAAWTNERPLLLLIEDLHWCDPPTVELVDATLRQLGERPFLVLASGRAEVHERFPKLWSHRRIQEIRLRGLTRRASELLVHQALGQAADPAVVERIAAHAAGNPFCLEELAREAAKGNVGGWPATVLASVAARIERLPERDRRVLRAASVFGQSCTKDGILALLGAEDRGRGIDEVLDRLVAEEVLVRKAAAPPRGAEPIAFRHALLREAAYAMLTEDDRRLGHSLAARWLERSGEPDAAAMALHLERGKEHGRSAAWFERAAWQALRGDDLNKAIALADRAFEVAEPGEGLGRLSLLKAEAHRWRGANGAAHAAGVEAMTHFEPGSPPWFAAAGQAAAAVAKLGRVDALVGLAESIAAHPPLPSEHLYVQALGRAAIPLLTAGRYDWIERLIEPISSSGPPAAEHDPAVGAWAHRALSLLWWARGDVAAYLEHSEAAARAFVLADDVRNASSLGIGIGIGAIEVGAYRRAERALEQARADAARMHLWHSEAVTKHHLAVACAASGHTERALELQTEAAQTLRELVDARLEGAARLELGRLSLRAHELDEAEHQVNHGVALIHDWPSLLPYGLAIAAGVLLERARATEALARTAEAVERLEELGRLERGESFVRWTHARAIGAAGDHRGYERAVQRAHQSLMDRAAKISSAELRQSFLASVPDNARIVELMRG